MKIEKATRLLMCAIVAAAGMCGSASWAQNFPVKPVRYVIPFSRIPEIEQRLTELGMPPAPTSREEFDRFIRAEIARWAQVIKDAGIPKQ